MIPKNAYICMNGYKITQLGQSLKIMNPQNQLYHLLTSCDQKQNIHAANNNINNIFSSNEIQKKMEKKTNEKFILKEQEIYKIQNGAKDYDQMILKLVKQNKQYQQAIQQLQAQINGENRMAEHLMQTMTNNINVLTNIQKKYYQINTNINTNFRNPNLKLNMNLSITDLPYRLQQQQNDTPNKKIDTFQIQKPSFNNFYTKQVNITNNNNKLQNKYTQQNKVNQNSQAFHKTKIQQKLNNIEKLKQQTHINNSFQQNKRGEQDEQKNQFLQRYHNSSNDELFANLMPVSASIKTFKNNSNLNFNNKKYKKVVPNATWVENVGQKNKSELLKKQLLSKLAQKGNYGKQQQKVKINNSKQNTPIKNKQNPQVVPLFCYSVKKSKQGPTSNSMNKNSGRPSIMAVRIDVRNCK